MLTFAQKSNVRRHLDYPVVGLLQNSPAGGSLGSAFNGYRFMQVSGRMEWKLNNLNPDEEARLTGLAYAAVALVGPNPQVGDTITLTLSGGNLQAPVVLTATMPQYPVGTAALPYLGNTLASVAQLTPALAAAGIVCLSPFGSGPFNQNELPLVEIAFTSPVAFSISNVGGSGVIVPQVTANGAMLTPMSQVDGLNNYWGYLNILDALENAFASTSQNLDTSAAGPWKARSSEMTQRLALYKNWQVRLSRFLEIPIYTGRDSGPSQYVGASRFA